MRIYPIHLGYPTCRDLWLDYFLPRRAEINEQHGRLCYFGQGQHEKSWSWYEVDATITGPRTVRFQVYGMADAVYGGRGAKKEAFEHTYEDDAPLAQHIEWHKQFAARREVRQRHEQRERDAFEAEVAAVYAELFGEAQP